MISQPLQFVTFSMNDQNSGEARANRVLVIDHAKRPINLIL